MKSFLCGLFFLCALSAYEYKVEVDKENVSIVRVVIFPQEEIGLHRHDYPKIAIALQGGVMTRVEEDGRESEVEFPTGVAVYRPADPEGELHRAVNRSDQTIELLLIQIKDVDR